MKVWDWLASHWGPSGYLITAVILPAVGWLWRKPIARLIVRLNEYRTIAKDYPTLMTELAHVNEQLAGLRQAVELSGLRWRVFWQHSETGVYECDKDGYCTYANPALCQMFGLESGEMLGTGWLRSVGRNGGERAQVWASWQAAILKDLPYEDEYWVRSQRASAPVYVKTFAMALRSQSTKEVLMYHGFVRRASVQPPNSKDPALQKADSR